MATEKENIMQLIKELPDDVTLDDIMYHLYVKQKILRGLEDIKQGKFELLVMSETRMVVQLGLLGLACWFSSAIIFGKFNAGAEETTKMVAIVSMMSFMIYGFLFLFTAFGGT